MSLAPNLEGPTMRPDQLDRAIHDTLTALYAADTTPADADALARRARHILDAAREFEQASRVKA